MKKHIRSAAAVLALVLVFGGCGNKGSYMVKEDAYDGYDYGGYDADYEYFETTAAAAEKAADGIAPEEMQDASRTETAAQTGAKIIYTTQIDVETEHYDDYLAGVYRTLAAVGGHEQSSYIYSRNNDYRRAELTLRVPSEKREEFIDAVSGLGNVVSINNQSKNITLQYVDTESRIEALRTEQTRLLELLEKADNMYDILAIEERLTQVRYELQTYESIKNGYDYDVDYSTVTMSIDEVNREITGNEQTLGGRISKGFREQLYRVGEGAKNFLVWLASNFIILFLWIAVIALAVKLIYSLSHRGREKKPKKRRSRKEMENSSAEEVPHTENEETSQE